MSPSANSCRHVPVRIMRICISGCSWPKPMCHKSFKILSLKVLILRLKFCFKLKTKFDHILYCHLTNQDLRYNIPIKCDEQRFSKISEKRYLSICVNEILRKNSQLLIFGSDLLTKRGSAVFWRLTIIPMWI